MDKWTLESSPTPKRGADTLEKANPVCSLRLPRGSIWFLPLVTVTLPGLRPSSCLRRLEPSFDDEHQPLDGQLSKDKWLGDQVVAPADHRGCAALKVAAVRDEDHRRVLVIGEFAEFAAEIVSAHAGHINIQDDKIES